MVDKDAVRRGYDGLAEAYAAERRRPRPRRPLAVPRRTPRNGARPRRRLRTGDVGPPGLEPGGGRDGTRRLPVVTETDRGSRPGRGARAGGHGETAFRDGSFDAATAYRSLIHVPRERHQAAVDEFARALADGGRLLCSEGPDEWRGTNPDWLDTGVEMQWHIAGVEATREHLRTAGFAVEREGESPTRSTTATTRAGRSSRRGWTGESTLI